MNKALEFLVKSAALAASPTAVVKKFTDKGFDGKSTLENAKEFSKQFGVFGQVQMAATVVNEWSESGIFEYIEAGVRASVKEENADATYDGVCRDIAAMLVEACNASGYAAKLGRKKEGASVPDLDY